MHVENAGNKACSLHQYILSVYVYVCCGQLSGGQSHIGINIATPLRNTVTYLIDTVAHRRSCRLCVK